MIVKIEVCFAVPVDLPKMWDQELSMLLDKVCKAYEEKNPDRVMWTAEHGSKITYLPMTKEEEEERGMEFDTSIYYIGVSERKREKKR